MNMRFEDAKAALMDTDRVALALLKIRVGAVDLEKHLYPRVESALLEAGIAYRTEVKLAPRCRIDFLCERDIGIEVKKGKITGDQARSQLRRYEATGKVRGLVFLVERYAFKPDEITDDIPVAYVALHRLHGVAL